MAVKTDIPQADIDELAKWLFNANGSPNGYRWDNTNECSRNRWRAMSRRLLTKMPSVLVRHAKEAT